jgi:hypothetical protein
VDRTALGKLLVQRNVHPGLYSLDGPAAGSESYSLVPGDNGWGVLYKERGKYEEVASGLSEAEACSLMYKLLSEAFSPGQWRG